MTLHRVSPEEYAKRRQSEIRTIDHFAIHFSNKMNVECKNDESFTVARAGQQVSNVDIKIDVYDLRVGDKVCIRGVRGVISEIDTIRKSVTLLEKVARSIYAYSEGEFPKRVLTETPEAIAQSILTTLNSSLLEDAPGRLDLTPRGVMFTLFRNAGMLARCIQYAERYGEIGREDMVSANLAEARGELGDVITQCRVLAEVYVWDYQQVVEDGQDRFETRCRELHDGQI